MDGLVHDAERVPLRVKGQQDNPTCLWEDGRTSRAGTPYTMTAGPEGVSYIETWGVPVTNLKTVWFGYGWGRR